MIKWLFFDMGGTLVDETVPWADRISRTAKANSISEQEIIEAMKRAAANNLPEYAGALERLGIYKKEKWNSDGEMLYPDAKRVLEQLKSRYKIGIIANQALDARKRLEGLGILHLIDLNIISAEVGFSKPHPILFREALYKAGAQACECVMIGDKLTNDIAPAKAMGFTTVWIRQEWGGLQTSSSEELAADYAIDTLTELLGIF